MAAQGLPDDWEQREKDFMVKTRLEKAQLRLRENRGNLADLLLLNTARDRKQVQLVLEGDPMEAIEGAPVEERDEALAELTEHAELERDARVRGYLQAICEYLEVVEGEQQGDRLLGPGMWEEIEAMFQAKNLAQLEAMEAPLQQRAKTSPDSEYWTAVLARLGIRKQAAKIRTLHGLLLAQRREALGEGAEFLDLAQFLRQLQAEPAARVSREQKVLLPVGDHWDNSPAAIALYRQEACRRTEEEAFNREATDIALPVPVWASQVQPKKPRYFNRVRKVYEWNNYNRVHYTKENPPPKVISAFRFNIYYPELLDATGQAASPSYHTAPDPQAKLGPDGLPETILLYFHAPPPYTDLVFRIPAQDWSTGHRHGFRSMFDRGVLRLHFHLRKRRPR